MKRSFLIILVHCDLSCSESGQGEYGKDGNKRNRRKNSEHFPSVPFYSVCSVLSSSTFKRDLLAAFSTLCRLALRPRALRSRTGCSDRLSDDSFRASGF